MKQQVVAILMAKKEQKVAAVAAEFDALILEVESISEPVDADVVSLQQKVAELEAQVAAVQAAFDADEILDNEAMAVELEKEAKLQAKLNAIKAALEE